MIHYTIGIYFDATLTKVALLLKNKPTWQTGKYNFPGGHVELTECIEECVIREFKEECGITIPYEDWKYIGVIKNLNNYKVNIFTAIKNESHGELYTGEEGQEVQWFDVNKLPKNIVSNLIYLIPFALNYWKQGNPDNMIFGTFNYIY